ncbi:hypothetical protein BX600DRAFT_196861 [Xylariales sp. PMI_506]|nr:hypothetical protein BX600DRAFT_196861 [Xylariales sp. PMI_506]
MEATGDFNSWKTFGGYAILIGVGGAMWYQSYQKSRRTSVTGRVATQSSKQTPDFGTDAQPLPPVTKKKAEKAQKPKPKPKPAPANEPLYSTSSDFNAEADAAASRESDRAFAQLMSQRKEGTKLTATKTDERRQKSVKQSRAQEIDIPTSKVSAPSSTTGDADDDMSPATSPVVNAADSHGVSDMLEPSAPGPSVLRLTGTDAVKTKEKKAKPAEVAESKKQRQNRQKAERKKLEREQDELERKKLEEAQRRRARIAEGRPAKDGSGFIATQSNAWNAKTNGDSTSFLPVQPLDTFEAAQKPAAAAAVAPKPATGGTKSRSDSWMSSLPSEEEQIAELLKDEGWNEVPAKKGKKTKKAGDSSDALSTPVTAPAPAPKAVRAPLNGSKTARTALSSSSSFAALTPEETTDDNEEQEWDV